MSRKIFVIPNTAVFLAVDFRDNPFPEFDEGGPARTVFTGGERTEITGVVTQKLTRTGNADAAYFRVNVTDAAGVVTPWAVFIEHDWQVPKIIVGEMHSVPGIRGADGTNRFVAFPF